MSTRLSLKGVAQDAQFSDTTTQSATPSLTMKIFRRGVESFAIPLLRVKAGARVSVGAGAERRRFFSQKRAYPPWNFPSNPQQEEAQNYREKHFFAFFLDSSLELMTATENFTSSHALPTDPSHLAPKNLRFASLCLPRFLALEIIIRRRQTQKHNFFSFSSASFFWVNEILIKQYWATTHTRRA